VRFHIIGIGGAGMSAVAQLLLAWGHEVTGSDSRPDWPLAEIAAHAGATVVGRFDRENVAGADIVVRSSAYRENHPEVLAARDAGIPVWRRQDAWAFLARGKKVVAVAGTHGKTTTTGLVWSALRAGGLDPSLICGGELVDIGSNAYAGKGEHLVIEADEYDHAFLALDPAVAVATNVDHDHVDMFPTREDVERAFRDFARRIVRDGRLIACADDPGSAALSWWSRRELDATWTSTYGLDEKADWRIVAPVLAADGTSFELTSPNRASTAVRAKLVGLHNARNVAAAIAAADACGVAPAEAAAGVMTFSGTKRRLETIGTSAGVRVIDDYAHHPAEIRASLEAAHALTSGRIIAVFQPHTPSRLAAFLTDFASALRLADTAIVVETFASARESSDEGKGARELARQAGAFYAETNFKAARRIASIARDGDLVLVLGAGDVREAGQKALALLAGAAASR
jgi:UDP-N-acetylmuramate--alanine ligase